MRNKRFAIGAALALSVASPAVHAQSAAALSIAPSLHRAASPERAGATARAKNDLAGRYSFLLPAVLVAAAIAAVVLLSIDNNPSSP